MKVRKGEILIKLHNGKKSKVISKGKLGCNILDEMSTLPISTTYKELSKYFRKLTPLEKIL